MGDAVSWKKRLKAALGRLIYATGLHRFRFRDRATIVLFHRVDDELGADAISCTSGIFDAYCRFFARHFDVVSLSGLLDRIDGHESIDRCLVITFDDGYKDNRDIAAPILAKHGLTACFFVATDFIGSNHVAWWDATQQITSSWMHWDDVRALEEDLGFEVGAHTCNHVDLGKVSGGEAKDEIESSRARLEAELGHEVRLFSYPYGGEKNIMDDNRQRVRQAGFRCCCSAYGGGVRADSDRFDLRRIPVSQWYASPYQLGFELLWSS